MRAKDREGKWFINHSQDNAIKAHIVELTSQSNYHPTYDAIILSHISSIFMTDQTMDKPYNWKPYHPTTLDLHRGVMAVFETKV
jgi:hypothetical protein